MSRQTKHLIPLMSAVMIFSANAMAAAMERPPRKMPGEDACKQGKPVVSDTGKHLKQSPKEVEKYWTRERMRNARPMEMNVPVKKKKNTGSPCGK